MSLKNKVIGQDMTIHFSSINQKQESTNERGHMFLNILQQLSRFPCLNNQS